MDQIIAPNVVYGSRYRGHNNQMLPYAWAYNRIFNKQVADLGSGRGHGSFLMSYFATSIDQYEISASEVKRAKQHNYFCPTTIYHCNLEEMNSLPSYDVICGFEFLDHLEHPEKMLSIISKSCETFLFCVPHNMPDPKHFITFQSTDDVAALLMPYFKSIKIIQEKDNIFYSYGDTTPFRYFGEAKGQL